MTDNKLVPIDGVSSPETEIREVNGVEIVFYAGEPIVELGRKKSIDNSWVHPEPGYNTGRCKMIKKDGQRCGNAVREGQVVCHYHGAGYPSKPGGRPPVTGRYSRHLPARLIQKYEEFLTDPDIVSLRSEMALIDTRISELVEQLEDASNQDAWLKIRQASSLLRKASKDANALMDVEGLLEEALDMREDEEKIWSTVFKNIDQRRKLAEAERRRIESAQHYLTMEQASSLIAFLIDTVKTHVQDPQVLSAISQRLGRLSSGAERG